ncbi:acyl transferase/acyl hydrolase/lysophospholipase [Xylaria sp. FL0043]|nr:acyl transferase/acyl hydrolase/lysophospholipase [Xylaria sp. FL0043]
MSTMEQSQTAFPELGSHAATFERLVDLVDGMLEDAIRTATEADPSQPFLECLKLVAEQLDDYRLRLSIWSKDIIHEDPDGDVSIADVLDILEGVKSPVAQELGSIFADAVRSLILIQHSVWRPGAIPANDVNLVGELEALRCSMDKLEHRKFSVQSTISELFRNEIQHRLDGAEPYKFAPSTSSVLCLDGGGVRSYSSLLILEALMVEVRRRHAMEQADSDRLPARSGAKPLQPHDVFDYIYGSSSGGLLAIMLGRLKMPEKESMETFQNYCGMIFGRSFRVSRLLGGIVLPLYSDRLLIKATKLVVGEFDPSPEAKKWRRNMFSAPGEHCKTAALAIEQKNKLSDILYVFRSFDFNPTRRDAAVVPESREPRLADDCQIWQVARATSAAPTYFSPIEINGRCFMDSGIGTNNPAAVALYEVGLLNETMKTTLLISIGTGSSRPASRFGTFSRLRALVNTATETEETHHRLSALTEQSGDPYFRFSGPDLDMELDEWRTKRRKSGQKLHTIEFIRQQTMSYLEKDEVRDGLRKCADLLVDRWWSRKRQNVAANIARSQKTRLEKPIDLGEKLDDVSDLGDRIVACFQQSKFPVGIGERQFLPEGRLDRLITRVSVVSAIGLPDNWEQVSPEDKKLVNFVVESAKKVFAITVTAGMGKNDSELHKIMHLFQVYGFGDASLPVKPESWAPENPLIRDLRWRKVELQRFLNHQWTYLAPIFPETVWDTDLEPDCILPFTSVDSIATAGAFGSVYQVTVHPSHQEAPLLKANGEPANVAVKEVLMTTGDEDVMDTGISGQWQAEAKALKRISTLKHPYLIAVKAIVRKAGKCYFMFPWGDGGNLREFFKENPRPRLDTGFMREVFLQLRGLADAVNAMHHFGDGEGSLRHGDLKPHNIVRFLDETRVGTLKIADMALAKYHEESTNLRDAGTEMRYGTGLYEPPEVMTMADAPRSRRYDIWSMGCIYLDFLIWLLYGYEELLAFHHTLGPGPSQLWRLSPYDEGAELHPGVVFYLEHIARDPECERPSAIRDLLVLIRARLLVIRLHPQARSPVNETKSTGELPHFPESLSAPIRADSRELCSALADILTQGERDERYWFTGVPRDGSLRPIPVPSASNPLQRPRYKISARRRDSQ